MSESVILPALGESVTEGTVTRWLKNVGDRVEVDEPLLEVSTDKVDTEIPSPIAGVIEAILVQEDETVEVGTPWSPSVTAPPPRHPPPRHPPPRHPPPRLHRRRGTRPGRGTRRGRRPAGAGSSRAAPPRRPPRPRLHRLPPPRPHRQHRPRRAGTRGRRTGSTGRARGSARAAPVAAPAAARAPAAAPAAPAPAEARGSHAGTAGYVTPIVRKLANEAGVDLSPGHRHRRRRPHPQAGHRLPPAQAAPRGGRRRRVEVSPLRGTTQPMSRLRKVVAERAVISMNSSAQLTTVVEVDVTRVAMLRDKVKADFQAKTVNKLSFLPFFALAAAEALRTYPIINATFDGDQIVYPAQENISIAVDTERGLLTPGRP